LSFFALASKIPSKIRHKHIVAFLSTRFCRKALAIQANNGGTFFDANFFEPCRTGTFRRDKRKSLTLSARKFSEKSFASPLQNLAVRGNLGLWSNGGQTKRGLMRNSSLIAVVLVGFAVVAFFIVFGGLM
jgi:hypothetical protein